MSVTRVGLIGAMIAALVLHSGCSFLFVKGPPANHAEVASFDCSDSNAWPVVDLLWAGLNGLGAASAAGDQEIENRDQVVGVGVAWLVVSGISAIYGFNKVSQCNDAKRKRNQQYESYRMAAPAPMPAPAAPVGAPAPGTAAPAAAPSPAAAPAPAPAPAPPAAPASAAPAAAPVAPNRAAPSTSLSPPRSRLPAHLAVRSSRSRSLAMRPASATD
jgi:type IV secretory pathway VirB10-like protein